MKITRFAVMAIALLAFAACGLRDNPAVPPAPGQAETPAPASN